MQKSQIFINWDENYIIGNDKIDSEHKELFKIAKKANDVYKLDEPKQLAALQNVVDELYSYVDYHLKNEEAHMREIAYPELVEHKMYHKELLDMLNFISLNLPILSIQKSGDDLYNFVQKIFVKHIIKEDTKIIKFIEENK